MILNRDPSLIGRILKKIPLGRALVISYPVKILSWVEGKKCSSTNLPDPAPKLQGAVPLIFSPLLLELE